MQASSAQPASVVQLDVSSTYRPLIPCGMPLGEEPCRVKVLGASQVLAWNSRGLAAIEGVHAVASVMTLPNYTAISNVIITSHASFLVLGRDNRVYFHPAGVGDFQDITFAKSGVLPETFSAVSGGVAWASRANSIVLVDGETGKQCFKAKLSASRKEKVTTIASVGNLLIAVGTSKGRVVVYDQKGIVQRTHIVLKGKAICRLIGDSSRHLAVEGGNQVVVLQDVLMRKPAFQQKHRVSLMPQDRSLQDGCLLVRYTSNFSKYLPPLEVWNLERGSQYSLKEPKFAPGAYAEFTVDGRIVGGGGAEDSALRIWDLASGECLAETSNVQAASSMDQATLGLVLCPSSDEALGLVDITSGTVTLFETPSGIKIESFVRLPEGTIIAAGHDGGIYRSELISPAPSSSSHSF